MGEIEAMRIEWYAARMLPLRNAGRRTAVVGAKRTFVHELLLRRAGFEVFLPVRKEWRITDRFRKRKEQVAYPLMTGWLFVGWPEGQAMWGKLAELGVVQGLLGDQGRPARISEAAVQRMMRQWGGGHLAPEHYRYLRTHHEFEVGDTVRVIDGPWTGYSFDVLDISSAGVSGVVQLLGRSVGVDFAPDLVEVIDSRHRYVAKNS